MIDIESMSNAQLEKLIIGKKEEIKHHGEGKITRRAIAVVIGCFHDEYQTKILFKRLRELSCIKIDKGKYSIVSDEKLLESHHKDAIKSNPLLKEMDDECSEIFVEEIYEDWLPYIDDDEVYHCKDCQKYTKKGLCKKHGKKKDPDDERCYDDDGFLLDLTIGDSKRVLFL